jgi:hypothetical protein
MVQISEVKGNARDSRTATHTHIKGLGLRPDGLAERQAAGFVGQTAAREVRLFGFLAMRHMLTFSLRRLVEWLSTSSERRRWLAEPYYLLEDLVPERQPSL